MSATLGEIALKELEKKSGKLKIELVEIRESLGELGNRIDKIDLSLKRYRELLED